MIPASGNLLLAGGDTGYNLTRSLRTRASASAYLNRTNTSAVTNNAVWTYSAWAKLGYWSSGNAATLLGTGAGGSANECSIKYVNNQLNVINYVGSSVKCRYITTAVYRDPSAWYHVVVSSNSSTSLRIYINGVQITVFDVAVSPDASAWGINTASTASYMGWLSGNTYFDGHLAEVNFIDGQALTPSSFGETDTLTGVWKAKKFSGTYGTNGFYLNFNDNSAATAAAIGKDSSGNGNNWTPNNISLTAGATYDSMTDVPTLTSATAANFAVLNPLKPNGSASIVNGNLSVTPSGTYCNGLSTIQLDSGAYYAECTVTTAQAMAWGIWLNSASTTASTGTTPTGFYGIYSGGATLMINGTNAYTNAGASPSSGDIVQVAWSNGKVWFGKNNTWYDSTFGTTGNPSTGANATVSSLSNDAFAIAFCGANASPVLAANFGQRPFAYTPPTGFVALNTNNIAAGTVTTSGAFTGNVSTDGPFVYLNGTPTALTINGNAVTWGVHADKLANGFKVRSSSTSYNSTGTNTYSVSTVGAVFKYANAQGNP